MSDDKSVIIGVRTPGIDPFTYRTVPFDSGPVEPDKTAVITVNLPDIMVPNGLEVSPNSRAFMITNIRCSDRTYKITVRNMGQVVASFSGYLYRIEMTE